MYVPFHDGVISQFEGYADLAELDWEHYRRRYGDIQRLDRILESEGTIGQRLPGLQAGRRADAVLLAVRGRAARTARTGSGTGSTSGHDHEDHRVLPRPHLPRLDAQRRRACLGAWPVEPRPCTGATSSRLLRQRHCGHPGRYHGGGHPPRRDGRIASTCCSAASPAWKSPATRFASTRPGQRSSARLHLRCATASST